MKALIFLFAFLSCWFCFGAAEQDVENVVPKTLDWNDNPETDINHYTVHCEVKGTMITLASKNVSTIISELSLNDPATRASLGITIEGQEYDCAVIAWDHNAHNSNFSAVVTYFFDMTPPGAPSVVTVEDR